MTMVIPLWITFYYPLDTSWLRVYNGLGRMVDTDEAVARKTGVGSER